MSWYDAVNMGIPGYSGGSTMFQAGSGDLPYIAAFQIEGSLAAIPEPESYAMLLAGLGMLGYAARRRKQKERAAV